MASFIHAQMRSHGVKIELEKTVTGFSSKGGKPVTMIKDSEPISSDMVLLGVGVEPDTALAEKAGLALGIRGAVAVNEYMETSVPDIYAVGDAVEVSHFVTGEEIPDFSCRTG